MSQFAELIEWKSAKYCSARLAVSSPATGFVSGEVGESGGANAF